MPAKHPPPPAEPKSFYVPIAVALLAAMGAVSASIFSGDAHADELTEEHGVAAEPVMATVPFGSTPRGAEVRIGEERCTTPCELRLEADQEVEVQATLPGHVTATQTVTPNVAMEAVSLTLEAGPRRLGLGELPEGAEVYLDDTLIEDPTAIEIEAGATQALRIERPGHRAFETTIEADAFEADGQAFALNLTPTFEALPQRRRRTPRPTAEAPTPEEPAATSMGVPTNPF